MIIVYILFLFFAALYITFQCILLIRILFYKKPVSFYAQAEKPRVSILIAARNEEHNILRCLEAIQHLHYPKDRMEVWIGDDQSTDRTQALVTAFIKDKPNHHLVTIQPAAGRLKGKANVLAQLAKQAGGEFLFITDADIKVPVYWIEGLLGAFEPRTGIVSGSTIVEGSGWMARIQRTDWAYAFGMVHVVSDMNKPVTAVGNNMAIRRSCYDSTGGYEQLEFSVTEDLELFMAALQQGWGFRNLLEPASACLSAPLTTLKDLLHQRKRWITGAFRLPNVLLLFLAMQAMYFPVLLLAFCFLPWIWVLVFWLTVWSLQTFFVETTARRLGIGSLWKSLFLFECNRYIFPILLFSYRLLPLGVEWKGRVYKGKEIQP